MSKPTTIRLSPETLARAEAVRLRSQVPITTSAVLQEAVRRGLGDLERERGVVRVKLGCVDMATPEIDRLSAHIQRLCEAADPDTDQPEIAARMAGQHEVGPGCMLVLGGKDAEVLEPMQPWNTAVYGYAELKFKEG